MMRRPVWMLLGVLLCVLLNRPQGHAASMTFRAVMEGTAARVRLHPAIRERFMLPVPEVPELASTVEMELHWPQATWHLSDGRSISAQLSVKMVPGTRWFTYF